MRDMFKSLFGKKNADSTKSARNDAGKTTDEEPFAPNPVREQFRTGIPILKTEELRSLVRDGTSPRERPEFAYAALYLIIKASAASKDTQMRMIQDVADIVQKVGDDTRLLRTRIRDYVETELGTRNDWAVDAHTLQGRIGKNLTVLERMYDERALRLSTDTRDVFIVGHATFLALPAFIHAFQKTEKTLFILMPKYIASSELDITSRNEPTGIKIEHGRVSYITAGDYAQITDAVVVDDIKSTGATERQLQTFLTAANPQARVSFEPVMRGENAVE